MVGAIESCSAPQTLAAIPEFFWELGLGVYLIVKGFKPSTHRTAELADAR